MKRPDATPRERTVRQLTVVPVSVVVQLFDPAWSAADVAATGATAAMSGVAAPGRSAAASCSVKVEAEPNPPRVPDVVVELPGEITSTLVPSSLIWSWTFALAPWPIPTVSTTAVMPIRMPSIVNAERRRCVRTASVAVRNVSLQVTGPRPRSTARPRRLPDPGIGRRGPTLCHRGSGSCAARERRGRLRG